MFKLFLILCIIGVPVLWVTDYCNLSAGLAVVVFAMIISLFMDWLSGVNQIEKALQSCYLRRHKKKKTNNKYRGQN